VPAIRVSNVKWRSHLWSTPVPVPFCRTYDVLRQSSAACKALKVPEKAGVGGSTPSLATISFHDLANQPEISHL
jgi:hypothetical protein